MHLMEVHEEIAVLIKEIREKRETHDYTIWGDEALAMQRRYYDVGIELGLRRAMTRVLALASKEYWDANPDVQVHPCGAVRPPAESFTLEAWMADHPLH